MGRFQLEWNTKIKMNDPLLTQHEPAEYISRILRVSARQVYDRYVHFPGFPKPFLLPSTGKVKRKRYVRQEIIVWTEGQRRAA